MPIRRKKAAILTAQHEDEEPARISLQEQPKLPEVERAFFDMLLQELYGGLQELEQLAKKSAGEALLHKCTQARGTVAYAQALLRLEDYPYAQDQPEELPAVFNAAANSLRREFLYAGVTLRRPPDEQMLGVIVPDNLMRFLLEEMVRCCLRCAPRGRNLHVGAKRIGAALLLSMRTEGRTLQQTPLIPPLHAQERYEEDYGFALCQAIAALGAWEFRWEADEAGVRMFLDL